MWYSEGMEESATTSPLTTALEHYLGAANMACLFPVPMGKGFMPGTLNYVMSSDSDGSTLVIRKPPNGFADPEYFEPQLERLKEQLADCDIALERIESKEAPQKSRLKQFFSLKAEPTNNLVAFEVTCNNEPQAIAALEQKVQEIERNAEQKKVNQTLNSIESAIPKDMPPELAAQVLEGFFTLGVEIAQKHKIPVPSIAVGELGHAPLETAEKAASLN